MDAKQRLELIHIKQRQDPTALPYVLRLLGSPNAEVRARAADALAEIGDSALVAVARGLTRLLTDDEPTVRYSAIQALGALRCKSAASQVAELLQHDHDPMVKVAAAEALGYLGDPAAVPALLAALTDADAIVRSFAACSCGLLSTAENITELQRAVGQAAQVEADLVVRLELLIATYRFGDREAKPRLRALLFNAPGVSAETSTAILNGIQFLFDYNPPAQINRDVVFFADLINQLSRSVPSAQVQVQGILNLMTQVASVR